MIATIAVKVNAAKPNFPLQPLFAFQGSPSSLRILDVPKSIGNWAITSVKVAVEYPDNTTIEKSAVRSGSVWVATVEGCEIAGKVSNGYEVIADGKDEDGNDVTGYVLGKGDVYVIENNTDISRLLDKIAVRYIEDIPDVPTKGDLMNSNCELRLFDGNDWILISTGEHSVVYDSQITIQKNGTSVGSFTVNASEPKSIDIPVPSRTSDIENDVGYITANALPTKTSDLTNDSGFITLAQVPTPTYIEDANGNKIEADLDCNVKDLTLPWILVDGADTYTLNYDEQTSKWRYEEAETKKIELSYGAQYSIWELDFYLWNNDEWHFDTGSTTTQDKEATSLTILEWTLTRSIMKNDKLAKESDLPTKTSDLVNDSGFITASQVPPVPSNLSDYNNDVGFITASAIPSNVGAFTNDVGYLTTSSSAFVAKRDKTDMSAVVGTTYASWNLSALHSATYSPALELKWGTYKVFGQEQECWLVDDEYRQVCFFLLPELNMLYWGNKNQDGSYIAGYGETITLSSDELSIATINGVAEITCTRTSKDGSPEISTIATLKDLNDFKNINEKRDWWDNTTPASVDDSGKYTINTFSLVIGSNSYFLDQFSASGGTSTWKSSSSYPSITTTDGLNFTLNYDSSTSTNFTINDLKPGPATGTIGGNNYSALANFMLTTYAMKDYVDGKIATKRDLTDISYSGKDEDAFFLGVGSFTIELPDTWTVTERKTYVLGNREKNRNYYKLWSSSPTMFYINTLNDANFSIMDINSTQLGSFTWNQVKGGNKVAVTITYQGVQYSCNVQANWETTTLATANDVVKMSKSNTLLQGENIRINTNGQSNIGLLVANQNYNGYALTQSGIAKYDSNSATKTFNFPSGDATGSTFATREWVQAQGYSSGASVDDYIPVTINQNLGSDSTNYQLQIYNHQLNAYMTYETNSSGSNYGYSTMNFMVFKVGSYTLKDSIDINGVLDDNNWYVEYSDYNGNFYRSVWGNVCYTNMSNFLYVKVVKD